MHKSAAGRLEVELMRLELALEINRREAEERQVMGAGS